MNLKESWGSRTWRRVDVDDLITHKMSDYEGGNLEYIEHQIDVLAAIVGRLVEHVAQRDQDRLDIVGLYGWEIDERSDEDIAKEQLK